MSNNKKILILIQQVIRSYIRISNFFYFNLNDLFKKLIRKTDV